MPRRLRSTIREIVTADLIGSPRENLKDLTQAGRRRPGWKSQGLSVPHAKSVVGAPRFRTLKTLSDKGMKSKEKLVRVRARDSVDSKKLEDLAKAGSSISISCGTAGPSIARQIIKGNGSAEVSLHLVQMAIDTQDGVEAIFDHFILEESKSRAPLGHWLIRSIDNYHSPLKGSADCLGRAFRLPENVVLVFIVFSGPFSTKFSSREGQGFFSY